MQRCPGQKDRLEGYYLSKHSEETGDPGVEAGRRNKTSDLCKPAAAGCGQQAPARGWSGALGSWRHLANHNEAAPARRAPPARKTTPPEAEPMPSAGQMGKAHRGPLWCSCQQEGQSRGPTAPAQGPHGANASKLSLESVPRPVPHQQMGAP